MAHVIKIKRSETASVVPDASDLEVHEIAMNTADQKLYTKDSGGNIVLIASHQGALASQDDLIAFSIALG
jgi:hypothetical protein